MAQVRTLLVAPYPQMEEVAREVAEEFPELDLTVMVGDLQGGVDAMRTSFQTNFDVIVSRGGTAEALERATSVPVIKIELSVLDVMRQVPELRQPGARIAAVGFANALDGIARAQDLLSSEVDLLVVSDADHAREVLEQADLAAYDAVLCDNVSYHVACDLGIDAQLLASGADSIRTAFGQAIMHTRHWRLERERANMLWEIARSQQRGLVIYLCGGELMFSNLTPQDKALYPFLEAHLADEESRRLVFRREHTVYRITPIHIRLTEDDAVAFSIIVHREPSTGHVGIRYCNAAEVAEDLESGIFWRSGAHERFAATVSDLMADERPVLIRGEVGTGKEDIARMLYRASDYVTLPFVLVDFELLGEKSQRFLLESYHSPFFEGRQFIFLRGLNALEDQQWHDLLATLIESGAARRNFLVISTDDSATGAQSEAALAFGNRLFCRVVETEPLRADPVTLLDDADRYLRALREQDDGSPTLDADAQDRLIKALWPRNYHQLKRVLERAAALAGDGTVDDALLSRAIGREEVSGVSSSLFDREGIDLLKPLADTERQIALLAVMRCEGNRSLAARTLGISRTTLWRLLQDTPLAP